MMLADHATVRAEDVPMAAWTEPRDDFVGTSALALAAMMTAAV